MVQALRKFQTMLNSPPIPAKLMTAPIPALAFMINIQAPETVVRNTSVIISENKVIKIIATREIKT